MRILFFSWFFLIPLFQILSGKNLIFVSGQVGPCLDAQRSLLLQLKEELNFTSPTKLLSWNESQNCCNWDGVNCDSSGHVISLELDNETITGGIENSSSLFSLQYLEILNLAYNNFWFIQIPSGFGNLTNLTYLNLSDAGFAGQVPIGIGRLTRLVTLDLSTRFTLDPSTRLFDPSTRLPVQPLELANPNLRTLVQDLRELRILYLDGVNISAHGSEWCNALSPLSNLRELSLRKCYLSGPIDSSLSELRSLSVFQLDRNNLSAPVPDFFRNFSNLTVLSLIDCNLQEQFPQEIFQVPTLRTLHLSNNFITGSLPEFPQNGSFRTIELSHTNFSGSLPDSIGNLQFLSHIDLSNCNFSGPIPSTMANLKDLVYLDFSWNSFNGPIPSSLFAFPSLQKLLLSNNLFDGQVNEFLNASTSSLDTLDLSSNQLKGSVPKSFFELRRLNVLSLSSNYFNGTLQLEMVKGLLNLTRLELSYNNLSIDVGSSNATLSTFPQLTVLKLASCNLQEFPDLKNQSRMFHLDLSGNKIKGEIPNWIWEVVNGSLSHLNLSCNHLVDLQKPYTVPSGLSVLDLHSNLLQGQFPTPPSSARYVDYSRNKFNNSIPSDIGGSTSDIDGSIYLFLSLANNNLIGSIPKSICNAAFLHVLDLSDNFLSGSIPECLFQNMEYLGVLNLGRNKLNGTIPDKFVTNCGLRTLDLSRNLLEGPIPGSLVNCTLLEVLNVGTNRIEDKFPCKLKNLSSLSVLVLRSNMFHGDLHCAGADESWSNIQIIDIASNKFSGNLSARYFLPWKGMMRGEGYKQSDQNHLRLEYLTLSRLYYQDTVTVTMKGLELELQKILRVFTSIDFSCNEFQGSIPETVGDLKALYVLNLSYNALTGTIPKTIGNLTQLGSLDLSRNHLTGMIPAELGNLTFLSFLNLSYNNLSGQIPKGRQLQTFQETSFQGDTGLCGFPLNKSCNNSDAVPDSFAPSNDKHSAELHAQFKWQFIFTGLGFVVGATVVLAPLIICKEVRKRYDGHLEKFLLLIFPKRRFKCSLKIEFVLFCIIVAASIAFPIAICIFSLHIPRLVNGRIEDSP